jgi:uncharacterized membrane protein
MGELLQGMSFFLIHGIMECWNIGMLVYKEVALFPESIIPLFQF